MCNRLKQHVMLFACGAMTILFIGCDIIQDLGAFGDVSIGVVSVIPATASPGTTVRVEATEPIFGNTENAKVQIGGQVVQIVRQINSVAVEVLVPNIAPGDATVQILEPDRPLALPGRLSILPSKSLQLVISLTNGRFELLVQRPGGTHPRRRIDPGGRRIQYEVFNELGRLVFKDVLTHPTLGRVEVYDETDSGVRIMHRLGERDTAVFAIMVPNVPGGATIRFYDVPEGVVADSLEGRRNRIFLTEMSVSYQTEPMG